ncbi:MAG: NPCBM/NEW2 domain-containing protein [Verrucomicrobia bacterium]|nr:NPCBM/NEW2 domain-containing protein [Verrucomicrobiota bacterium]
MKTTLHLRAAFTAIGLAVLSVFAPPVQAAPPSDMTTTPLAEVPADSNTQAWGSLQINKAVSGSPLTIAGRTFTHGLGTHAASEIVYTLEDGCETFTAWVGVDDHLKAHPDAKNASVVFQVIGDGKTLFESGIMRMGDAAKAVKVPLKGVTQLKLIVTDAGDGNSCDHADWGDAALTGTAGPTTPAEIAHTVKAGGFSLNLAKNGSIISGKIGNTEWPLSGDTRLRGFRPQGEAVVNSSLPNQACTFTRTLVDAKGHTCTVTDRFTPTRDSIRWEVAITSAGNPWSTTITTGFNYAATANSRFGTTWGHPDNDPSAWADPLAWQPFANRTWGYQFPDYTQMGSTAKCNLSIPMFTVAEPGQDIALTFMQSPEDTLLDLSLSETSGGSIRFQRDNYRLGEGRTVRFHISITATWSPQC